MREWTESGIPTRNSLRISLSIPQYADEMFALTDRNRPYLRQWLPWLDGTCTPADTRQFLTLQVQGFARGESLHVTIFSDGSMAGVAGFNSLDRTNGIGYIGYWLGEEFTGKGIMTTVVRDLIEIGRSYYALQKVDIRCATRNSRSRAIPERLGFSHEGTLRRAERVYDQWLDHEVYALLVNQTNHNITSNSCPVRNRLDFPDGAILGPFKGTSLGPSLFIEFSCRTALLKHSVIGFSNRIALRQPSQVVTLRDPLEMKPR